MQGPPLSRPENQQQRHACKNHSPLDAEQGNAQPVPQIHQEDGGEGTTNQQVNGGIVEPAADPLGPGSGGKGVVDAAHQHHQHHADAIEAGGHHLQPAVRSEQQQRHGRRRQNRACPMAGRVEPLLASGQHRRFVFGPNSGFPVCTGLCPAGLGRGSYLHPDHSFYIRQILAVKSCNIVYKTILHDLT